MFQIVLDALDIFDFSRYNLDKGGAALYNV